MRRRRRRPPEWAAAEEVSRRTKAEDKSSWARDDSSTVPAAQRNGRTRKVPLVFVLFVIVVSAHTARQLLPSSQSPPFSNCLGAADAKTIDPSDTVSTPAAAASFLPRANRTLTSRGNELQRKRKQQLVKQTPAKAQVIGNLLQSGGSEHARQRAKGDAWRATKAFRNQQENGGGEYRAATAGVSSDGRQQQPAGHLQVSITPRVSLVRVPVESNAILKCLISSQAYKFTRPFKVRWSRFMYDESVYEQIESSTGFEEPDGAHSYSRDASPTDSARSPPSGQRSGRQAEEQARPAAVINRQQQLRDFLQRSSQETNVINDLLVEATLSISQVRASDNASYFCSASSSDLERWAADEAEGQLEGGEQRARIDLLALSRPVVRLERVQSARDSKSALVLWSVLSSGNTPIKKTILMVKNESQHSYAPHEFAAQQRNIPLNLSATVVTDQDHQQWQKIDIAGEGEPAEEPSRASELAAATGQRAPPTRPQAPRADDSDVVRASIDADVTSIGQQQASSQDEQLYSGARRRQQRAYNLTGLLPGASYQLKLAALNDMGQSGWSQLQATMPNEIPAQIQDVVVLSNSNDSITIGWRRPPWDGARTIRYEMQLFDLNRTLTLDANTNTTGQQLRTNYMFHFVNLQPGTDYHFHIRACSRAGCSAYSSPKLLASTLDGEPDEPLDVQLQCSSSGQQPAALVSWLPPREARGRLLNYSIRLESSARYRNQSGHWASDEWRETIETGDNHTLSFELASDGALANAGLATLSPHPLAPLMPNTNYSVRVCANNRSKGCGRLSQVTARSQCSIAGQLPRELPMADIRLSLRKLEESGDSQRQAASSADEQNLVETLHLEFPFMSWRNGSIDCVQVVLIRLPQSFDGAARSRPMSDFLPGDPAEMQLHEYIDLVTKVNGRNGAAEVDAEEAEQQQQRQGSESDRRADKSEQAAEFMQKRAFAYLAEELDSDGLWPSALSKEEVASGRRRIVLGDGRQLNCQTVWRQASRKEARKAPSDETTASRGKRISNNSAGRRLQPLDGSLMEDTYYTGFLRLVQVRLGGQRRHTPRIERRQSGGGGQELEDDVELLTKYSYYFSPVKTGKRVPQVPIEALLAQQQNPQVSGAESKAGELGACRWQFLIDLQSKLLGSTRACRVASEAVESVRRNVMNLSRSLVGSFSSTGTASASTQTNLLARLLQSANSTIDGPMQVLQVGMLVVVLSLLLLLVIYLFTLPATMRRRRKQRKLRKQLDEHEAAAAAKQAAPKAKATNFAEETGGFGQQQQQLVRQNHCPDEPATQAQPLNPYQQDQQQALEQPVDCAIHSSPMREQPESGAYSMQAGSRRQSVHVCQAQQQALQPQMAYNAPQHEPRQADDVHYLQLQRASQSHSQCHLDQQQQQQRPSQMLDYSRNCRTMRPSDPQNAALVNNASYFRQQAQQQHSHQQRVAMTLQHGAGSLAATVLATAKKINKSIPLALFHSVLDVRLRNGWLREEYEQLPRAAAQLQNGAQQSASASGNTDGRHIRLRPQLIVSRDDSISALISGNEFYEGSLVRLQQKGANCEQKFPIERQFVCAKSPLDADSVWDFWRLIYELEVATLVMLTPNEDVHTGELRCAQYWPTCDNEETTILSPCNEHVQSSTILPAKFKIRQETLSSLEDMDAQQHFKVRRLTLLVMATRLSENEHMPASRSATTNGTLGDQNDTDGANKPQESNGVVSESLSGKGNGNEAANSDNGNNAEQSKENNGDDDEEEDEERLVIVERTLLHFQFLHWNASSSSNQAKLIKFIEFVNERHTRQLQQLASPGANWQQIGSRSPILVHCANGLGRSGLFAAMSFVIDDLHYKLTHQQHQQLVQNTQKNQQAALSGQQQQLLPKVNLFQLVAKLRSQRDMLLSPYRFYELLYQLTARCIPVQHQQLQ